MPTVHRFDGLQLRENYGFAARELTAIKGELAKQLKRLYAEWRAIHGE